MTSKYLTEKKGKEGWKSLAYFFAFAAIFFLIMGLTIGIKFYQAKSTCYPDSVNIPQAHEVDDFCESKDYEYGWLDSRCGLNEVTCFRYVGGNLQEFTCIKWERHK